MNKKQISKIVSVIVTLIVISAIVAVGILLGKVSKEVSGLNNTETTESGGASVPESTVTQAPADTSAPVAPTVYGNSVVSTTNAYSSDVMISDGVAQYVTLGNVTYFYVKYDVSALYTSGIYDEIYLKYYLIEEVKQFEYENIWMFSVDGITWKLSKDFHVSGQPQYIYVSCTHISNCINPETVYFDLVENFYNFKGGETGLERSMFIAVYGTDPDSIEG